MENLSIKISLKFLKIVFFLIIISSCDSGHTIEYNLKTNFIYKNLTSEKIDIILYDKNNVNFKKYSIDSNNEVTIIIERDGANTGIGQPFRIQDDSRYIATKVVVKFLTSNKCLTFLKGEGLLNEKLYDNFSESMYSTSNNTLIYNIDSEELNLAIPCL